MKTKAPNSNIVIIIVAAAAALFLAGCAEMEATNTKSLLSAAGFRVKTPQTPLQKEVYAALPAYHVSRVRANSKVAYAFKDEKAGVAYVGESVMDPASYYDNNVTESLVLEAVRAAGIDCVVFSSS